MKSATKENKTEQGGEPQMRHVVKLSLMAFMAMGAGALADDVVPAPFADFTFKRVTPPKAGAKRITTQIDPAAQAAALAVTPAPTAPATAAQASDLPPDDAPWAWFWNEVSPLVEQAGPANLRVALDLIERRGDVAVPRLQDVQEIARAHGPAILMQTIGTRVSPALVVALISVESAGRATAQSPAGAVGLMQLIPATAARFGAEDRTDPTQNIKAGVAYLNWLINYFQGDHILALAAYNAGENAVKENGGVPPFAETRAYVPKVLAAWRVARGLCLTPPELMSDGCVFAVNGS